MKIDLSQFRQTFLQESAEHVASMEAGLFELRSAPDDVEILNAIFRAAHSIKGGAGSFGMKQLVRFTHALENLLDRLRALEMSATEEVIGLLLQAVDIVRALLEPGEDCPLPPGAPELMAKIEELSSSAASGVAAVPDHQPAARSELKAYRVDFHPAREMFLSGTNPILLLRDLAALGTVSVCELRADKLPPLEDLDPEICYLSWTMELATTHGEDELREVFEFVEHLAEIRIQCLDAQTESAMALTPITPSKEGKAIEKACAVPTAEGGRRGAAKKSSTAAESSSIRVETNKIDRLIDLVGELVIAQVMTAQIVDGFTPDCLPKLRDAVAAMERNTRELHERVMGVRMLPIGPLFQRYMRTIYDIAQSTGKQIRLEMEGEETEIDKSMLELLSDPLTHLVRNSADHGIESPAERKAAGKPEEGTITLRAFHRAGRIVIEITDDGAGIDPERVRRKAIERGLITADAQLSDEQVKMLIFEAGFSTRDTVSDLSGRGVGMDVVRRNVEQLNGTVSLFSEKGTGSTVSVELPLTLAILEGLLVRVADRTLVLPLLSVVETVAPGSGQVKRVAEQGEVVVIREESIPLLRLRRFLGLSEDYGGTPKEGEAPPDARSSNRALVVVVESGRKKIGLVVEELLGQQQVVVKSLEKNLRKVGGLMGATILGDGCVAPIVDVTGLANLNLYSLQVRANAPPPVARPALGIGTAS